MAAHHRAESAAAAAELRHARRAMACTTGALLRVHLLAGPPGGGNQSALGTGHRTLDENEAALDIGLHDLEIKRGHALDTEMARHLLVLEGLAGILTAAGATNRTMRNRHAVRRAKPREIPALHTSGKAFSDVDAANINELARDEVVSRDLRADWNQCILGHAEFGEFALGLDLLFAEIPAVGLDHIVGTARARAKLERDIAILVFGAVGDHLALRKAQHRYRHVFTGLGEHPGHSDLLCDYTRTHC